MNFGFHPDRDNNGTSVRTKSLLYINAATRKLLLGRFALDWACFFLKNKKGFCCSQIRSVPRNVSLALSLSRLQSSFQIHADVAHFADAAGVML